MLISFSFGNKKQYSAKKEEIEINFMVLQHFLHFAISRPYLKSEYSIFSTSLPFIFEPAQQRVPVITCRINDCWGPSPPPPTMYIVHGTLYNDSQSHTHFFIFHRKGFGRQLLRTILSLIPETFLLKAEES